MVSGFFTSPNDHERILSGEAMPILIASKCSSGVNCLKRSSSPFILFSLIAFQFNVDAKGSDLLDQDIEGFRHAGVDGVLALDDVFVDLGAAIHVVGLHG